MSAAIYNMIHDMIGLETKFDYDPKGVVPIKVQVKCLETGQEVEGSKIPIQSYDQELKGSKLHFQVDKAEPILIENPNRFTLFPIMKPELYRKYKDHISVFWHVDEVDLSKDMKDWNRLNDGERHFIKYVLAFFAGSDGLVMENLGARFMREVQLSEARAFYAIQMAI